MVYFITGAVVVILLNVVSVWSLYDAVINYQAGSLHWRKDVYAAAISWLIIITVVVVLMIPHLSSLSVACSLVLGDNTHINKECT